MDKTFNELTLLNSVATQRKSKLNRYSSLMQDWIRQGENIRSIQQHLKDLQVNVHYTTVRSFVRKIEHANDISSGMDLPGEMGYISIIRIPQSPSSYLFCFLLGYSFYNFFHVMKCRDLEAFLECNERCFYHLSGVPKKIRFCEGYSIKLTAQEKARYKRYLASFGARLVEKLYKPNENDVCSRHAYRAKNEIFGSFLHSNMTRLITALKNRHINSFNLAIHPITKNPIHKEFEKTEKPKLLPYPGAHPGKNNSMRRKVSVRGRVCYQYNFYQLPKQYYGKTINVVIRTKTILFTYLNRTISVYQIPKGKGRIYNHQY